MPDVLPAQAGQPRPVLGAHVNPPPWGAPRAAYLLTAAMADRMGRDGAVAGDGGMSADWPGSDASAQRDILAALGAQTRLALRMLRDRLGVDIDMESAAAAGMVCPGALAAVRELIEPAPEELSRWRRPAGLSRWRRPAGRAALECADCREGIAKALCGLQIDAYFRLGFAPAMIAAMCRQSCRQSADVAGTPPRH